MAVENEGGGGGGCQEVDCQTQNFCCRKLNVKLSSDFISLLTDTFGTAHSITIAENNTIRTFFTTYKVI